MTTQTSSVPSFRAALVALVTARSEFVSTPVCDGPPEPAVLQGEEYLCLLEAKGRQVIRAMGRNQPREERYTQTVELSVRGETRSDQVTLGDRAFELLAALEDGLRTNANLAGLYAGPGSLYSVTLGMEDYQTFADDRSRESRITVGLDVHARL